MYEFARGDNITLPCTFVPKATAPLAVLTWTAIEEGAEAVRLLFLCGTDYSHKQEILDFFPF